MTPILPAAIAALLLMAAPAWPSEPVNLGDARTAAVRYHDFGEYDRDLAAVGAQASAWVAARADAVAKPALVLDIDETALSNWEVIRADDFGRVFDGPCDNIPQGPCGWVAWDLSARDTAIGPTLDLYRVARAHHVAVFFISGRDEHQREATERNLKAVGYDPWDGLYLTANGSHYESAADFKTPVRARIVADGYTIIANVGDQPSDLNGGYAERTFLLPDPFYRVP